jgi:hypothetical protein
MSEKRRSVLLTENQIAFVRASLSYSADAIRNQPYDAADADRVRRQRADEDMIASVREALSEARPAR